MNIFTIAFYELKRILRNRRLVLIVLSQPIVISLAVGLMVFQNPKNITIGLINKNQNQYSQLLEEKIKANDEFIVTAYSAVDEEEVKNGNIRAFVVIDIDDANPPIGEIKIFHDPAGHYIKYDVESKVRLAASEVAQEITLKNEPLKYSSQDLSPFDLKNFDYFASAIMVLLIILVVLNLSGISITTERAEGTFERLFVTPYSKIDVIFGKTIALFLVGTIVAFLGTISLYLIYHISIGNAWLIMLINLLVGATAVTLGLLISSLTYTVVESVELAMYCFFISVIMTGILSPIETAQKYFVYFIKIIPFYYAVDASRRVNMVGASWSNIAINIYILIGAFLFFLILSIVLLRRKAK